MIVSDKKMQLWIEHFKLQVADRGSAKTLWNPTADDCGHRLLGGTWLVYDSALADLVDLYGEPPEHEELIK